MSKPFEATKTSHNIIKPKYKSKVSHNTIESLTEYAVAPCEELIILKSPSITLGIKPFLSALQLLMPGPLSKGSLVSSSYISINQYC